MTIKPNSQETGQHYSYSSAHITSALSQPHIHFCITFTQHTFAALNQNNHVSIRVKSNHLATLFLQLNSYYTYCGLIIAIENFDSLQKHAISWFNMTHEYILHTLFKTTTTTSTATRKVSQFSQHNGDVLLDVCCMYASMTYIHDVFNVFVG